MDTHLHKTEIHDVIFQFAISELPQRNCHRAFEL